MLDFSSDDSKSLVFFKCFVNTTMLIVAVAGVVGTFSMLNNAISTYQETQKQNVKSNLIETDVKEKYKMLDNLLVEIQNFSEAEFYYRQINAFEDVLTSKEKHHLTVDFYNSRIGIFANLDKENEYYHNILDLTERYITNVATMNEQVPEGGVQFFADSKEISQYFEEERNMIKKMINDE